MWIVNGGGGGRFTDRHQSFKHMNCFAIWSKIIWVYIFCMWLQLDKSVIRNKIPLNLNTVYSDVILELGDRGFLTEVRILSIFSTVKQSLVIILESIQIISSVLHSFKRSFCVKMKYKISECKFYTQWVWNPAIVVSLSVPISTGTCTQNDTFIVRY